MSSASPPMEQSLTKTIARNSLWYGFEQFFSFAAGFAASVAMARVIGPTRLGYFNYVMWLVNMSALVGNMGVPATTRKYMAEYLGKKEFGQVRHIFFQNLRAQIRTGLLLTGLGIAVVWWSGDPQYRLISTFLVASMLPNFVLAIPSQANIAAENYAANVPASAVAQFIYVSSVLLSLWMGWDLLGIAIGIFVGRWVELLVRLIPAIQWMRTLPVTEKDPSLFTRMRKFSFEGTWLMLLNLLVWNRSDILFLKALTTDLAQISFYTVGYNLTDKILLLGRVFSGTAGSTLMAQYGRDPARINELVSGTVKYLFLLLLPLLGGLTALSWAIVPAIYGEAYREASLPLAITSSLCVLSALVVPARMLMQAREQQRSLIIWTAMGAAVNIGLDVWLVPHLGAVGAAIGNGAAQLVTAAAIWWLMLRLNPMPMPWGVLARTFLVVVAMSVLVGWIASLLPVWPAIIIGTLVGGVFFLVALRWARVLNQVDYGRLRQMLPKRLGKARDVTLRIVRFLTPEAA